MQKERIWVEKENQLLREKIVSKATKKGNTEHRSNF